MKKILLCLIVLFSLLLVSGCTKEELPKAYTYISYEGKQFIKQSEGVYKNDNEFVYYQKIDNKTEITMTFSDVVIYINPPKNPEVKFPDGCSMFVTKNGVYGGSLPHGHYHDFSSYASLTYEQIDNTTSVEKQVRNVQITYLIVMVVVLVILSFFVFNIDNVLRIKIWYNSIIPMHKEPYEPSDLNVGLSYIGVLISYVIVIYYIIQTLIDLF